MSPKRNTQSATSSSLDLVVGRIDDPVFALDTDWQFTFVNSQTVELLGYDGDGTDVSDETDLLGERAWTVLPESLSSAVRTECHRAMETQEPTRTETHIESLEIWIRIQTYPAPDGLTVCLCDVTSERADQRERETKTAQLEAILQNTKTPMFLKDTDGAYVLANQEYMDIFDLEDGELIGRTDYDVHPKRVAENVRVADQQVIDQQEAIETEERIETRDGERIYLSSKSPIYGLDSETDPETDPETDSETPDAVFGVANDITERTEYEAAVERAHEELRQIIDLVPDLIFAKSRDGEYLLANETTADAYGLTPDAVEGRSESDIIPEMDESKAFRADDLHVIESGELIEIPEEELTTADGDTRILRTTKIPYEVAGTDEDAILGYGRDITDLKEYEHRLEAQRDNLTVLNQIVRHDIRNVLQLILASAETLEDHVDDSGTASLDQILNATHEAVDITTTAREMTEILLQSDTELGPIRLRYVLEDRIEDARSSDHTTLISIDGSIPDVRVLADDMLESVFRNLLQNAIVHTDADIPEIHVSARTDTESVRIAVADNGPGVPDHRKTDIFEKGTQELDDGGTGLGLYLVRTLVDRYGGDVWVEDNDAEGATFIVELQRVD